MKIRNIILGIAALASIFTAQAQGHAHPEPPIYDTSRASNFIEIGAHAAMGVCSHLQNYSDVVNGISDFQTSPGTMLKLGADVRLNFRNSFGIATGLEGSINNSRFAMNLVDLASNSIATMFVSNHYYELTVPVYVSFRFNIGRHMKWNTDAGIYFANGFGGYTRISGYASGENALGQPIVTQSSYKTDYFKATEPFINGVKNFDWGPRLGTGLLYRQKYSLNVIFQVSASNLALNKGVMDVQYRNILLAFQMGYIF